MKVTNATPADAADLAALGELTFAETFAHLYTAEDLAAYMAEAQTADWYTRAIADPDTGVWIIRDADGSAIGYGVAGRNTLPIEDHEPEAGEVKRLYLRQSAQGHGLGKRLLAHMLDWLDGRGYAPLYIGVYSDNPGAIRLYAAHGFSNVGEYHFMVGSHADREFILKREATS
ncbi:GNAT family N-acetyltransferase [Parvularcula sp. LCG005]|uniref:GNAT family N-acetyltransferase n=1 Tax=Parvularcula sp. LCG005 TaxID=3078805 RepID=UPI00294290AF|nr:GNAT family N-acetyltransferase [Parvularcula sp. LCG005]WOI53819.1 GNAT family N-acetyltransferase [Parvularcula sp. LCG005]